MDDQMMRKYFDDLVARVDNSKCAHAALHATGSLSVAPAVLDKPAQVARIFREMEQNRIQQDSRSFHQLFLAFAAR